MISRDCTKSKTKNKNSFNNLTETSTNLSPNIYDKNSSTGKNSSKKNPRKHWANNQKQTNRNHSTVLSFQSKLNNISFNAQKAEPLHFYQNLLNSFTYSDNHIYKT